jgi:hypothetical protein
METNFNKTGRLPAKNQIYIRYQRINAKNLFQDKSFSEGI